MALTWGLSHPARLGAEGTYMRYGGKVGAAQGSVVQGKSFNQILGFLNVTDLVLSLFGSQALHTGLGVVISPLGI